MLYVCVSCLVMSDSANPTECGPPDFSGHGILQARILELFHALLQGIFLTQESNLGLLHCRQILYCLSHQGSPLIMLLNDN